MAVRSFSRESDGTEAYFNDSGDHVNYVSETDSVRKIEVIAGTGYELTEPNGKSLC